MVNVSGLVDCKLVSMLVESGVRSCDVGLYVMVVVVSGEAGASLLWWTCVV